MRRARLRGFLELLPPGDTQAKVLDVGGTEKFWAILALALLIPISTRSSDQQLLAAGVGGERDVRDRPREFSTRGGASRAGLIALLSQTVERSTAIIHAVTPQRLLEEVSPQDGPVPVLDAIYRVTGHFQLHAGQILFATKISSGQDLGFYKPPQVRPRTAKPKIASAPNSNNPTGSGIGDSATAQSTRAVVPAGP